MPIYVTIVHGFFILLRSTIPFVLDDHAQYYFDALKHALTFATLITPLDFTKDFILYISASVHSVTGVLIQEDDDWNEHVIYYVRKNLVGPHVNYSHENKFLSCSLSKNSVIISSWVPPGS